MPTIRCVVERITYKNEENGYCVIRTRVKNYVELVTVVGNMPGVSVGSVLNVTGEWKRDAKYGRQFVAGKWEETLPATVYGIEKYLGSGLIHGVGPRYARKIVEKFGEQTLEIIETDPDRLIEVPGVGARRVKLIKAGWEAQKEIKDLMMFLQEHEVTTAYAARIYKAYAGKSIEKIRENPYCLADDVWGIGFKTADGIACKLGMKMESFYRCRAGLMYTLNRLADDGHCFAYREQLLRRGTELLDVEEATLSMTLDYMTHQGDVIVEKEDTTEGCAWKAYEGRENLEQTGRPIADDLVKQQKLVYLPAFYHSERGIAQRVAEIHRTQRNKKSLEAERCLLTNLERIEREEGIRYDEVQREAIRNALTSKVMLLTGGPGTGKTTTTSGIIRAFQAAGLDVLLAAPTGRAAKRMTETSGIEAKTIHRLLEYQPPEGYKINEKNPLSGDVLIVDE